MRPSVRTRSSNFMIWHGEQLLGLHQEPNKVVAMLFFLSMLKMRSPSVCRFVDVLWR